MTPEDAFAELVLMCAPDYEPQLSEDDLLRLLARARRPDSAGVLVGATDYVTTYDLHWAAMKAWEMKAGRCVDVVGGSAGGSGFAFDQMFAHCREMAAYYRRAVNSSIPATAPEARWRYSDGY